MMIHLIPVTSGRIMRFNFNQERMRIMDINKKKIAYGIMAAGLTVCAAGVISELVRSVQAKARRKNLCEPCDCNGCCDCSHINICPDEMYRGCCCDKKECGGDADDEELESGSEEDRHDGGPGADAGRNDLKGTGA